MDSPDPRFSRPEVGKTFEEKKVDSPYQLTLYSIGGFFHSIQTSAAGGRTKIQLLVKHDFTATDSSMN